MIIKMAADNIGTASKTNELGIHCRLVKFTEEIDLSATLYVSFVAHGFFCVSKTDESTAVLRLKQGGVVEVLGTRKSNWNGLHWDRRCLTSHQSAVFFTQDKDSTVLEFVVIGDTCNQSRKLHFSSLRKAIEEYSHCQVSRIRLVGYENGFLLFIVNSDTLCSAEIKKSVCIPSAWIPLPSEVATAGKEGPSCFQVSADAVAVLHVQAQLLLLYNLFDGQQLCQVDLQPVFLLGGVSDSGGGDKVTAVFQSWAMSPSLDILVWVDQQGKMFCLDLEKYIRGKPCSVKLPENCQGSYARVGVSHTVQSCGRGGFSWRQALVDLHLRQISSVASSVWSHQKLTPLVMEGKQAEVVKCKTRASGFRVRGGHGSAQTHGQNYLKQLNLASGNLLEIGYRPLELSCSKSVLTMVLVSTSDKLQKAICIMNLKSDQVYFHSLPSDHFPVSSSSDNIPLMLLSSSGLLALSPAFDIDQQDIVSKLMLHSGAQTADSLCQLNGWGRTTVPLHALELGLRQHQLDTVAFFLRTKETLFSSADAKQSTETYYITFPWSEGSHVSRVKELLPALDLFLKVINNDLPDMSPPWEFCLRLLIQTLEFLHCLLKDGCVRQSQLGGTSKEIAERNDLDKAMEMVMGYVSRVRDAMALDEIKQKRLKRSVSAGSSLKSMSIEKQSVDSVSLDSVDAFTPAPGITPEDVEKACRENELPALQAQLLTLGQDVKGQWGEVVRFSLLRAWSHVQRKNISAAQTIISNLGLNVLETVWQLAQFTTDRNLQQYVIQQLKAASTLNADDMALVQFLDRLYSAYPSSSVKQKLLKMDGGLCWSGKNPITSHLRSVRTNVASQAKDVNFSSASETSANSAEGPYCVMALHWLRQMDAETKERLLLDGSILGDCDESSFAPRNLWKFWLSRNQPDQAIQALDSAMVREKSMLANLLDEYLQDLSLSSDFVQNFIRTRLLRKKVYRWEILQSLKLSVEEGVQLMKGLLHTPHPLHGYSQKVLWEFHRQFADYCAKNDFVLPLWIYCSVHGLDTEQLLPLDSVKNVLWFKPFVLFHSAVNHRDGCSRMFAGSLSLASLHWQPDDWTLAHLLKEGHVMTAAATIAFLPETESSTLGGAGTLAYGVDSHVLRTGLQRFPKLLSALLPRDADTSHFDIHVYQLLRNNAPLDSRRLFGWQTTHNAASEDSIKQLPYFSQPDLVCCFGHTAKLNFTYYLRHGRPSYAFLSFLTEELEYKTSTLSPKRVQAACRVAFWLCVKNFHNCQVSSACVAFVEMLGRDSIVLRTYVHAGETLLAHRARKVPGSMDKRKEQLRALEQDIVSLLQSCLGNRRQHGGQLMASIEDAIVDEVAKEGLSNTSVEAALKWNLAILICHHLHLPLTTRFLELCAQDDRWLPFIWFAQLHQYPKAQLQQVLHRFASRHLCDHLQYIIASASNITKTSANQTVDSGPASGKSSGDGNRNIRSPLYPRIGVKTSVESGDMSSDEEEETSRREEKPQRRTSTRQVSEEDIDIREESSASDVFRVIFCAMATSEPWKSLLMHAVVLRNPLFAELAGCCNAPMISALCAWLVAMMSPTQHAHFLEHHGKRAWKWTASHLEKLMEVYLQWHAENTMAAAFFIFQPTSPLLPFLQFIAQCVSWRNFEGCKLHLDNFKDAMASISLNSGKSSSQMESGKEQSTEAMNQMIGDRDWLERVAYKVVQFQLVNCGSLYDAVRMLSLLAEENIALIFSFDVLDFGHLHKMLVILHKHQVANVHLPNLFSNLPEQQVYLEECQKALEALMAQGAYEDAYTFGKNAGLDLSAVVLRQLASEKEQLQSSCVWTSPVVRQRYWNRCAVSCARFHLAPATAAEFFQKEAAERENLREKWTLYKLALSHLHSQPGNETLLRDQLFTSMWRYKIQDRVANKHRVDQREQTEDIFGEMEETELSSKTSVHREELLHKPILPKAQVDPANELNSEEAMELEEVMASRLSEGHVSECCDLARLLGGQSSDLTIVLTCIRLSTGEVTLTTMDAASQILLTTSEKRLSLASFSSFTRNSSSVSLASAAPNWSFLSSAQEQTICTMEQLLSRCRKAGNFCLRIISVYKIACLVGRSYKDIVMAEEFSVLKELLKTDFSHRYTLAADFLSTSSLTDAEVASFLVDEIVKSLRIYLGGKDGFDPSFRAGGTSDLIFRPTEGGEVFSQLVSLCADPAILGNKLLNALATMADDSPEPSQSVFSMQTELLIMAHECHTAACNMEGISSVLRAARVCAQCLTVANQYQLMMRLLTGIGRYSEMTYIFDFLQQHHQFEMLLRKGIDKEDKLKTAILDYLKRFHSEDKDTYSMVALNFSMYREIAQMLDESGHRYLSLLKDKPLDANRETQDTMKKCIQYFGDAAESYAKDSCFSNTQRCLHWARLANLQLQLLGSGVRVINLTTDEVKTFAATHPKFLEAYVVTEAYGKTVDWSESLYSNVLMGADMRYLQDFRSYIKLTPSLIETTLYKLRQSPSKLTSCLPQVKKLLKQCPDIWVQYKIAQELGLQEVVKELLRNDSTSSYITDLISSQ